MKSPSKTAFVAVINDINTDQRLHRTCLSIMKAGYKIKLRGRIMKGSFPLSERPYNVKRYSFLFKTGPLMYACMNIRLFLSILFRKYDLIFSNDLDTLPACYYGSKIRGTRLIFDAHEYFLGLPELEKRNFAKKTWRYFEKKILPKLQNTITVNDSIAELYRKDYGINMIVIRNVPLSKDYEMAEKMLQRYNLPNNKLLVIYQGALNKDRGLEELIESMLHVPDNVLLIVAGGGDIRNQLEEKIEELNLAQKILCLGRVPMEEIHLLTKNCHLGVSIEKDTNLNYRFSLPNKIFDYIHAGIPVLASGFPEISRIFADFQLGMLIEDHKPESIGKKITEMLTDEGKRKLWKEQSLLAAKVYCWEKEEVKLLDLLNNNER